MKQWVLIILVCLLWLVMLAIATRPGAAHGQAQKYIGTSPDVVANAVCMAPKLIDRWLLREYNELRQFSGRSKIHALDVVTFVNWKSGTWSIVIISETKACILEHGDALKASGV